MITDWPPPLRSSSTSAWRRIPVELAHHVVEQHQRRRLAASAIASRSASSSASSAEPLLALRSVRPQLASVAQ